MSDATITPPKGTLARSVVGYVRKDEAQALPPPANLAGWQGWVRENLLSSPFNIAMTVIAALLLYWIFMPLLSFTVFNAVWAGSDREACIITESRPVVGACWPFISERLQYFIYGSYPLEERWRPTIFFGLLVVSVVWVLWLNAPRRDIGLLFAFVFTPLISWWLLSGGWGLTPVPTNLWGGILISLIVAFVGIVFSLPCGILLALGRRSKMPAVKLFSVVLIEFVRGVPFITVLFMASNMLPLFVPEQYAPDKLLRALIAAAIFASAYMAEVVRAGLQALPKGQYEGAMAMGLGYWQMMRLIILPQALKVTIPNIVNTYIGLFKDTTLVVVVGLFDFLKTIEAARIDPKWAAPTTSATGYMFAAIFYFICCYAMSRYAKATEERLAKADKR
ncbi:MAG: amino acid ABC transporter permease [Beijerinckiaceae bacterium]